MVDIEKVIDPELERRIRHRELEGFKSYHNNAHVASNDVSALLTEIDRLRRIIQLMEEKPDAQG